MRGEQERCGSLFSYVSIEERIPDSHPLRRIRKLADQALDRLNPTFCELYASEGRPSVPPDQLLLEQLNTNLLFRWFVGLNPDDPVWHPTTFTWMAPCCRPDRIIWAQAHKPAEQQVVVELLQQQPLRADAIERLQQRGQQQLLRRHRWSSF